MSCFRNFYILKEIGVFMWVLLLWPLGTSRVKSGKSARIRRLCLPDVWRMGIIGERSIDARFEKRRNHQRKQIEKLKRDK
jgi:hypothetical protein